MDRGSCPIAAAHRAAPRQELRGSPPRGLRSAEGPAPRVGRRGRRHHGLRHRRRQGQRLVRDPEPLPRFRLGGGGAGHRRRSPEPRLVLQRGSRAPELLRPGQAAFPHPDGRHGHPRGAPCPRALHHGRRWAGHVPLADPDQCPRLPHGDPGGHRAAALHVRTDQSVRCPRPRAPGRARAAAAARGACSPGTQHPARDRLVRADRTGPGRGRARQRGAAWGCRSARRRRRYGILEAMQWLGGLTLVLTLMVAAPVAARAASWGGIEPGVTTLEQVRERYGAPSKETKQKVEGYDTTTWIYEGAKAPVGMTRMTVDLGMLKPDGFKPDLVRVFALEPKPLIFPLQAIIDGWGLPTAAGEQGGFPTMLYEAGLIVVFEREGQFASSMTFIVPQPFQVPSAGATPGAGGAAASPTPRPATPGGTVPGKPPASPS